MHLLPNLFLFVPVVALALTTAYVPLLAPANSNGTPPLLWLLTAQAITAIIITLVANIPFPRR